MTVLGIGQALPAIGSAGGDGGPPSGPADYYPNGFRYQLQRIIPADVHRMPDGGAAWFPYYRLENTLKSVANGGHVIDSWDHQFETGSNTIIQYELENWQAATGEFFAWLYLTGFRASVDYSLFHYYGHQTAAAEDRANPAMAWAGFAMSVNLATGTDFSGNEQNFTLTTVGPGQLFNAAAGDFG